MDKKEIRKILKNPSKDIVNIALSYVNLTDEEKRIIEYVEINGKSEEKTAEILDISVRNLQNIKAEALKKIGDVWTYCYFIKMIKGAF